MDPEDRLLSQIRAVPVSCSSRHCIEVSLFPPCSLTDDRWSLSHALGSCVPSNFGVSEGSLKFRGIRVRRTYLPKRRAPQSSPSSSSISDSDEHARLARALSILRWVSSLWAS